jgi:hypothetical protein
MYTQTIHTYIHTYIQACIHICIQTHIHAQQKKKKVLLTGTQLSDLYTAVDTPAGEAV